MMSKLLGIFGFDLDRQVQLVKGRAEEFVHRAGAQISERMMELGVVAGLAVAGGLMALMTFVIVLTALYEWVASIYGPLAGYATIGSISAVLAAVMFSLAAARSKSGQLAIVAPNVAGSGLGSAPKIEPMPPALTPTPDPVPPFATSSRSSGIPLVLGDLRNPLSEAVREFLAKAPTTGTPIDSVIDQVMREAAAGSVKTIDMAADLVRAGPRKAVFGVLAGTAVLGWFLAHKRSAHHASSEVKDLKGAVTP
jgi:hypothetical protein